jgi:hypothetical protein
MSDIQGNAFITTKKGFCYLTIKIGRRNATMMRVRKYNIEPDEKRHMRRLYPNDQYCSALLLHAPNES